MPRRLRFSREGCSAPSCTCATTMERSLRAASSRPKRTSQWGTPVAMPIAVRPGETRRCSWQRARCTSIGSTDCTTASTSSVVERVAAKPCWYELSNPGVGNSRWRDVEGSPGRERPANRTSAGAANRGLADGRGKLVEALGIRPGDDGSQIDGGRFTLTPAAAPIAAHRLRVTRRIGLGQAEDLALRFVVRD